MHDPLDPASQRLDVTLADEHALTQGLLMFLLIMEDENLWKTQEGNVLEQHFSIGMTFNEIHLDKAKNMEMISDYQNMDGNGWL